MNKETISENELKNLDIENPEAFESPFREQSEIVPPEPNKPKSKKKLVLIIVLAAVLLIGACITIYFLFFQPKAAAPASNAQTTPQEVTTEEDTTDYAKTLIDKIKAAETALVSKYPTSKVEGTDANAPAYKYGANEYYVGGSFGYSILFTSTNSSDQSGSPFMTDSITAADSVLRAEQNLTRSESTSNVTYQNDSVICRFTNEGYPFYAACANVRDYKPVAATIAPYAEALFLAEGDQYKSNTVFGTPRVTEKKEGYSKAIVGIGPYEGVGGYAGLFYGKDGEWIFWRGTQSIIPCEDYDTYALQVSFEGDSCYDEAAKDEDTKVKVAL